MNTERDNKISAVSSVLEQPSGVGKALREARERLGLSVNDVANRIKFAPKQIEWLEADDYVRLPEAAFVRGFVRSYARLLELDPARLLASLPSSHTQTASMQEHKSVEIPMPSAFTARRHNVIWLAAALVIALSLAIFERFHDRSPAKVETVAKVTEETLALPDVSKQGETEQLSAQSQPAEALVLEAPQQVVAAAPVPPAKQAVREKQAAPVAAVPPLPQQAVVASQPVKAKAVRPLAEPAPKQALPQQAIRAVPEAASLAAPAAADQPKVNGGTNASEHALRLEFDADAWVEIKDGSDKILLSRMHSAGSLVRVAGKAPLLVIIGNARAVRLFDNGKKINLERYTTAEVARVKLK